MPKGPQDCDADLAASLLRGAGETGAALCLCDGADLIRYANPVFTAAFLPGFDGRPADFTDTIAAAIAAGTGIRLQSSGLDDFTSGIRLRRRAMTGTLSFLTDTADGGWWNVTDTKLSNGWIMAVAQDISGLKREEARLREAHASVLAESQTDFLTGAPNRRHGLRRAEALWSCAQAAGHPFSLALLDLDRFKALNDAHGHDAGDQALVHFARSLMAAAAPGDVCARLGGDEFMLARSGVEQTLFGASLTAVLAALTPVDLGHGGEPLRLSVSVGVAGARQGDSWPALMYRADMALYDAKSAGRNRIASVA